MKYFWGFNFIKSQALLRKALPHWWWCPSVKLCVYIVYFMPCLLSLGSWRLAGIQVLYLKGEARGGTGDAELASAAEEEHGRIKKVILDLVSWEVTEEWLFSLCCLRALLCQEHLCWGHPGHSKEQCSIGLFSPFLFSSLFYVPPPKMCSLGRPQCKVGSCGKVLLPVLMWYMLGTEFFIGLVWPQQERRGEAKLSPRSVWICHLWTSPL